MAYRKASRQTAEQMAETLSQPGDWYPTGYMVTSVYYPGAETEVTVRRRDATGAVGSDAILYAVTPAEAAQWLFDNRVYLHPADA